MVKTFDTLEALLEYVLNANDAAAAQVGPEAQQFQAGGFYARLAILPFEEPIIIYGEILDRIAATEEAIRQTNGDLDDLPEDVRAEVEEEIENEISSVREMTEANPHYLFTRSYSMRCPKGELGDVHVTNMQVPLTAEEFERARKLGWPDNPAVFMDDILKLHTRPKGGLTN